MPAYKMYHCACCIWVGSLHYKRQPEGNTLAYFAGASVTKKVKSERSQFTSGLKRERDVLAYGKKV